MRGQDSELLITSSERTLLFRRQQVCFAVYLKSAMIKLHVAYKFTLLYIGLEVSCTTPFYHKVISVREPAPRGRIHELPPSGLKFFVPLKVSSAILIAASGGIKIHNTYVMCMYAEKRYEYYLRRLATMCALGGCRVRSGEDSDIIASTLV